MLCWLGSPLWMEKERSRQLHFVNTSFSVCSATRKPIREYRGTELGSVSSSHTDTCRHTYTHTTHSHFHTYALSRSHTRTLAHLHTQNRSFTHMLTRSLAHLLTHSFTHTLSHFNLNLNLPCQRVERPCEHGGKVCDHSWLDAGTLIQATLVVSIQVLIAMLGQYHARQLPVLQQKRLQGRRGNTLAGVHGHCLQVQIHLFAHAPQHSDHALAHWCLRILHTSAQVTTSQRQQNQPPEMRDTLSDTNSLDEIHRARERERARWERIRGRVRRESRGMERSIEREQEQEQELAMQYT
jgi:hypothetical protein